MQLVEAQTDRPPHASGSMAAYLLHAPFDADATDSLGGLWPGTWNAAYGNAGAGDGGVEARFLEGPAVAITGGHAYALSLTGCSASGGGTYFSVRWYAADGSLISSQAQSNWANCPSYQVRDWHSHAPSNATNLRLHFTYTNRYDDFRIQDLTALVPSSNRIVVTANFESGPVTPDGGLWPGLLEENGGDQGTGDAALSARNELSPAYGVTPGHTYSIRMTGCTTSGGSSQIHARWYGATGALVADNPTSDWPACPSFATRENSFYAPVGATTLRIRFAYHNRYDDLTISDLTNQRHANDVPGFPAYRGILTGSFDNDPNAGGTCSLPVTNECWPETWQDGVMHTSGLWNVGQYNHIEAESSWRIPAQPGVTYRLDIQMKSGGAPSRKVGFCFYSSDVPMDNHENRLECFYGSALSFDGYPWRSYTLTGTAPAGTTHVALYFRLSQYYDNVSFSAAQPPPVPAEHLVGSCSTGHAACPVNFEVDPVNTANGNYISPATDLALPGRGVGLTFSRTYNSLDSQSGDLGIGWRHSYSASLVINQDDSVRVKAEDGASYLFTPDGAGGFAPPPGGRSLLSPIAGGYELTRTDQLRYRFDEDGRLTAILDRNSNQLTFSYANGQLTAVTDVVGRQITVSRNAEGRISQLADPAGRSVLYGYDASGRLTSVTDLRGGEWAYTYDAEDRLLTVVDPISHTVVTNEYGPDGRISAQTDAEGNRGTFDWNAQTSTSTYTDARGGTHIDDYEGNRLVSQTDPLGNITSYEYDADLNRTAITDPRGNTTTMTYDAAGKMLTRVAPAPLGYTEQWTYNEFGDVLSYTDARGGITLYDYDAAGNLVSQTEPGSAVTTYTRDPAGTGLVVSVTDPRGETTSFSYDAQANQTGLTDPLGNVTTSTYDAGGRLTSTVDPRGNVSGADPEDYRSTFAYDGDLLVSATDALAHTITTDYDPAGNRLSVTDQLGNVTAYTYDAANRLLTVTDPDLNVTSYAYDAVGNLVTRSDANSHLTTVRRPARS